jgi:hypothetical protein
LTELARGRIVRTPIEHGGIDGRTRTNQDLTVRHRGRSRRKLTMDVANSHHIDRKKPDYDSDVTPEGVAEMRRRAAPRLEGRTFTLISSVYPDAPIGQNFRMQDGELKRVAD